MAEEKQNPGQLFQFIRGVPFPQSKRFSRKNIEDAMDFMPEDDDLIIASYPKTGTTWMQYIILQIKSKGELFPSFDDALVKIVPYLELTGIDVVNAQPKPRFYKHHLAYDSVQKNSKSKCLYIYRNPEDTVVSYYHFVKNMGPDYTFDFNEFFEWFLDGNIFFGSYFQHVLSFYKHRKDKNLLMISYEKLHANRKEVVLSSANFLGEEYRDSLLEDGELFDKIIEHTTFDYMKKNLVLTHSDVTTGVKGRPAEDEPPRVSFFRKGIVGDGKTVLTESQRQRLKAAAEKVLNGTSIIDEWYPKLIQYPDVMARN